MWSDPLLMPAPHIFSTHDALKATIYIDGLPSDMGVVYPGQPDEK
jgi:hypothetical protein